MQRHFKSRLLKSLKKFPCVVLTGPRKSGKTFLLKEALPKTFSFISLEDPHLRAKALEDPKSFLASFDKPVVIDEAHYAPNMLPFICDDIKQNRNKKGRYILTGSFSFSQIPNALQSLSGLAVHHQLLPSSWPERLGQKSGLGPLIHPKIKTHPSYDKNEILENIFKGGFPEVALASKNKSKSWYSSYLQNFLEKDLRFYRNVGNTSEFHKFMKCLAKRNGQILNMAEIGRELNLSLNTIKAWVSILVNSYQAIMLPPYYRDLGIRIKKSPKFYFLDSGFLSYLLDITSISKLEKSEHFHSIYETFIIAEITKWFNNLGEVSPLYHWKSAADQEISCLIETSIGIWSFNFSDSEHEKQLEDLKQLQKFFPTSCRARSLQLSDDFAIDSDGLDILPITWLKSW